MRRSDRRNGLGIEFYGRAALYGRNLSRLITKSRQPGFTVIQVVIG